MEDDFWCLQLFILSAILNLFTNIKEINKTLVNIYPQVTTTILRQCTSEKEHFDISHVYVQIHENSAMYIMSLCLAPKTHIYLRNKQELEKVEEVEPPLK